MNKLMIRCYHCKKIIWPWQKRMGYTTVAWTVPIVKPAKTSSHRLCDRKVFKDSLVKLNKANPNMFDDYWVQNQLHKREKLYH